MNPRVGVGVIIRKDGRFLIGKRKGSHGGGSWGFPGGHLEMGEDLEACAKRETREEVGIEIKNLRKATFTNDIFSAEKHYVTVYIFADYDSGEVSVMEPEKCERWDWFAWDHLPEPLFLTLQNLKKDGFDPRLHM
ncbi:NUDIX domain-containing protein [Candidatus Woesearchaeota archaeon]|nr:NUDIX domain-containing protein [Candidatus Woesearchaeota archaeon]